MPGATEVYRLDRLGGVEQQRRNRVALAQLKAGPCLQTHGLGALTGIGERRRDLLEELGGDGRGPRDQLGVGGAQAANGAALRVGRERRRAPK